MNKRDVLNDITFGARIAEDEGDALESYFVETNQWHRIYSGNVDIVYGPKGSGKSAIYALLLKRESELFDKGILAAPAENPRGELVFKDILVEPPTTENEFRYLWKLYFLTIIGNQLREFNATGDAAKTVIRTIEDNNLLQRHFSLGSALHSAKTLVRRLTTFEPANHP